MDKRYFEFLYHFFGTHRSYNSLSAGSKQVSMEGSARTIGFLLLGVPEGVKIPRREDIETSRDKLCAVALDTGGDPESVDPGEALRKG